MLFQLVILIFVYSRNNLSYTSILTLLTLKFYVYHTYYYKILTFVCMVWRIIRRTLVARYSVVSLNQISTDAVFCTTSCKYWHNFFKSMYLNVFRLLFHVFFPLTKKNHETFEFVLGLGIYFKITIFYFLNNKRFSQYNFKRIKINYVLPKK